MEHYFTFIKDGMNLAHTKRMPYTKIKWADISQRCNQEAKHNSKHDAMTITVKMVFCEAMKQKQDRIGCCYSYVCELTWSVSLPTQLSSLEIYNFKV